jgi:uncharacterized membrane protein YkvA (DUF1232 family)
LTLIDRLKKLSNRMKQEVAVLGVVYKDPRTPWYARALIFFIIAYSLSPIDLIPDFIPVLGYLDDLVIIPLGIALAIRLIPRNVFAEAREKVATQPLTHQISGWWFAGLVILIWLLILGGLVYFVYSHKWIN